MQSSNLRLNDGRLRNAIFDAADVIHFLRWNCFATTPSREPILRGHLHMVDLPSVLYGIQSKMLFRMPPNSHGSIPMLLKFRHESRLQQKIGIMKCFLFYAKFDEEGF